MKKSLAMAVLAATLSVGSAKADPFVIFVYETAADFALRADPSPNGKAYWGEWGQYAEVLKAANAMRGGAPLQVPDLGRVLSAGGPGLGAAGSGTPGPVQLGGFFIIDAPHLDAAAALAAQSPAVRRGGRAEVRPTLPTPGM